ncbi:MAG: bifunctional UDP-N-acetylmuramoyl-tripeptide:D-alanyl-D-alanine ligase/alanine racemase [Bacteroidia bacterium]|nr:bifunctional UDP-N-acetylmuramoyl-tripeptide:D-alanyl-D-alanine ligase/alanine racemase [Bacteroidia bacterium]
MAYSLTQIRTFVNGALCGKESAERVVRHLLIDSRKISHADSSLFFALKGERNDGHRYIPELYDKGVRSFIISDALSDLSRFPEAIFIQVPDTLRALQQLCSAHRKRFNYPVLAITGSNGKTIVKEWLFQLLREDYTIVRSPRSFNSQVGVPLSVWDMGEENTLAIFEAGISHHSEMEKLEEVIQPTLGLISNLGDAHSENFSGLEDKVNEKLNLFAHCGLVFYCKDYLVIHDAVGKHPGLKQTRVFSWSRKSRADLQVGKMTRENGETEIQGIFNNDFIRIRIPFTDEASIENAIHCWSVMLYLGIPNEEISKRFKYLSPVAMRLELKEGVNHCSVINDSYNSDLGSLSVALDFLNQQKQHPGRTLVLSDILQSGKDENKLYAEVADLIHKKGVTRLIGIGEAISRNKDLFHLKKSFYRDTHSFLQEYNPELFHNESILLKGARAFSFEEISKVLQQKAHETVLEINLNSLVHNYNYFRSKLRGDTKVMAMVKAFSYGSGSFEIANALQFHRIDYLAVAYADEGIELRKGGITMPIMVMNPEVQSYDSMVQYNLEPEIFSFKVLSLFDEAVKRYPSKDGKPFLVHLKLDTGMHRLGFEDHELNELIVRIKNNKQIKVKSVFSHLAASDENEHDEFTRSQIRKFMEMSDKLKPHFPEPFLRHILNSAGIIRFPDAQFEMVRLGIGMYGVAFDEKEQEKLQHVSTLKTTISQIKHIKAGDTVGYSRKGKAERDMTIATVPIGYADGLSRKLGNGKGKMMVHGRPAHVVGNVCMDMCMIDITGIQANEGDEVIVFGKEYPIIEVARDLNTIPYEVLTNVSRRVKRVYYQE